jgi:hypothetical protein
MFALLIFKREVDDARGSVYAVFVAMYFELQDVVEPDAIRENENKIKRYLWEESLRI